MKRLIVGVVAVAFAWWVFSMLNATDDSQAPVATSRPGQGGESHAAPSPLRTGSPNPEALDHDRATPVGDVTIVLRDRDTGARVEAGRLYRSPLDAAGEMAVVRRSHRSLPPAFAEAVHDGDTIPTSLARQADDVALWVVAEGYAARSLLLDSPHVEALLEPVGALHVRITGRRPDCVEDVGVERPLMMTVAHEGASDAAWRFGDPTPVFIGEVVELEGLPVGDYSAVLRVAGAARFAPTVARTTFTVERDEVRDVELDVPATDVVTSSLDVLLNNTSGEALPDSAWAHLSLLAYSVEDDGSLDYRGRFAARDDWVEAVPGYAWECRRACLAPGAYVLHVAPWGLTAEVLLAPGETEAVFFEIPPLAEIVVDFDDCPDVTERGYLACGVLGSRPGLRNLIPFDAPAPGEAPARISFHHRAEPMWLQVVSAGSSSERSAFSPSLDRVNEVSPVCREAVCVAVIDLDVAPEDHAIVLSRAFIDSLTIAAPDDDSDREVYSFRVSRRADGSSITVYCSAPGLYEVRYRLFGSERTSSLLVGHGGDTPRIKLTDA